MAEPFEQIEEADISTPSSLSLLQWALIGYAVVMAVWSYLFLKAVRPSSPVPRAPGPSCCPFFASNIFILFLISCIPPGRGAMCDG